MEITKDSQGWRIIPSTSDEARFLEWLLEPLQEYYGKIVVGGTGFEPMTMEKTNDGEARKARKEKA